MQYSQFISLITQGQHVTAPEQQLLKEFILEYPYCQSARILFTKALVDTQHVQAEKEVKVTAAYSNDRAKFQSIIYKENALIAGSTLTDTSGSIFRDPETDQQQKNSPFIDSPPVGSAFIESIPDSVFVDTKLVTEKNIFADSFSQIPVSDNTESIPEENTSDILQNEKVTDQHEIIRQRLSEIIGAKSRTDINNDSNLLSPEEEENVKQPAIAEEPSYENESNQFLTHAEEKLSDREFLPDDFISAHEEITLRKEVMKMNDEVDRLELAGAAEESFIHSLEKLPLAVVASTLADETMSFAAWLKSRSLGLYGSFEEVHAGNGGITEFLPVQLEKDSSIASEPSSEDEKSDNQSKGRATNDLIDRFIATEPRITPSKTEFYSPAVQAKRSVEEDDSLVSETLANIYIEQGLLLKARSAYEKLSLLYPEKSVFFAALIKEINNSLNNEE